MRASFICATLAFAIVGCGGKVIFDTGSSTGGANSGSTNGSTHAATTNATTTHAVNSAVHGSGTTVGSSVAVTGSATVGVSGTTGTGLSCVDPGAPAGSMLGTSDCGKMPCNQASTCAEACSALYDCGLAKCGPGGAPLCKYANSSMFHDYFSSPQGPCGQACMQNTAIKQIVDPSDCAATIQTLKSASAQFAQFCDQGGLGG